MFAAIGMTLHAILKIGDTFLQMLGANLRLRMLMTTIAGVGCEITGMTGDASNHTILAMIEGKGMLSVEGGGTPRGGGVARSTICAKQPYVENRIGMAGNARAGRPYKLGVDVAFFAVNLLVCARQREVGLIVIERGVFPIRGRMTGRTICSITDILSVFNRI